MKRVIEIGASALAFTSVLALSNGARAQTTAPAAAPVPAATTTTTTTTATAQGGFTAGAQGGGMTLPGTAPAIAVAGDSDHDAVIGTFGIGYMGMNGVGVGVGGGGAGAPNGLVGNDGPLVTVRAPIIGARYWVTQMIGIDAGIGLGIFGNSQTAGGADAPRLGYTAFLLHGGVPLNLASAGHFSFQVIPELNVGFGGGSQDAPPGGGGAKTSLSGFHFDIGARAGAEIHFGFIGLPKLALQGSVGLRFQAESQKTEVTPAGGAANTTKASQVAFATTVGDNPWNIFAGNVAALYYF